MQLLLTTKKGAVKLRAAGTKIIPALLVMFILAYMPVYAQDEGFNPDRDRAEKAFADGDYNTALKHYKVLRERFDADPVYAYYTGASMVELRQSPREAAKMLKEAILNSSAIRNVPDRAWYYLGRAYQLAGDFELAVDAYDNFRELARRREIRELDIEVLIDECLAGKGAIGEGEGADRPGVDDAAGDVEDSREDVKKRTEEEIKEAKEEEGGEGAAVVLAEQDNQKGEAAKEGGAEGAGVQADQDPGEDYESLAREALEYQFMADSVLRLADRYRAGLAELEGPDKQSLRVKILSLEQAGFEYQREADRKYKEAAMLASEKYDSEILPELREKEKDITLPGEQEPDSLSNKGRAAGDREADEQGAADARKEQGEEAMPDSVITGAGTMAADSLAADSLAAVNSPEPVLELFSEQYEQEGDIPVNPELPPGLFYRIQVAAFRNPKPLSFFNKLGPVSISRAEGSDVNFYFIGMFRSLQAAEKALVRVRRKGFSDAFILAVMDGERISLEKAEQLEDKWSDVSLYRQDALPGSQKQKEGEPPTLVYRVKVLETKEKVGDERLEQLERLAGSRAYDIFETEEGEYVYLIGNFLTFESAAAYADLLYRNGMKEAEAVAYMGKKEIPLETAKKLFDMYFEK